MGPSRRIRIGAIIPLMRVHGTAYENAIESLPAGALLRGSHPDFGDSGAFIANLRAIRTNRSTIRIQQMAARSLRTLIIQ